MSRYKGFRVNGWTCNFTSFTASELTKIADIPGPIQRLWRSRGQLPGGGQTPPMFDSRQVAEIMIRYDLSRLGIPPGDTGEVGCLAAQRMLWFALLNSDGTCEAHGSVEDTNRFLESFAEDDRVATALTGQPEVCRYLWKGPGEQLSFLRDLTSILDAPSHRAFTCIDLEKAALDLADRAGRPLFSIDVSGDTMEKPVRRLTGQRRTS